MGPTAGRCARFLDDLPAALLPIAVGLTALLIRVWALVDQRLGNPLFRRAILDDEVYLDLAARVLDPSAPAAPWFLAPLYPWVLAQAGRVFALDMLTASSLSVALGTLCAVLVALATRSIHSQRAGFLAGLLYALAGTFVFHDTLPGQEPLLCVLTILGLWAAIAWCQRGQPWLAGLVGVIAGTAMLGRATAVSLVLAAAWPAWRAVRPRKRLLAGVGLLLLGAAVVLVPAAVRNQGVAGRFTPFPWSAGPNLYAANGPASRAVGNYAVHEFDGAPAEMEEKSTRLAEEAVGHELSAYEVSDYWRRRTWREGDWDAFALHMARKAALFWAADEYGSNHWVDVERRFSTWLRFTPVSGWWLLALGLAGYWIARRRRPELDVAALNVVLLWGMLTVVYPVSRYRLPALVVAVVCAGCGAADLLDKRPTRRTGVAATALLLLATIVALTAPGLRPNVLPGYTYRNIAFTFMAEGQPEQALELLEEAVQRAPGDAVARVALARLLVEGGEPATARQHLLTAARGDDGNMTAAAATLLLDATLSVGPAAEALALRDMLFETHRDAVSDDPMFWACSARVEWAGGNRRLAREHLQRARAIDPDAPAIRRAEAEMRE